MVRRGKRGLQMALMAATCILGFVGPVMASPQHLSMQSNATEPEHRFAVIADQVSHLIGQFHFDPEVGSDPAYRATMKEIDQLARSAKTKEEFVDGFNRIWKNGPFSHVGISQATASVAATAAYLDQMDVGGSGASLNWQGEVAVLTVTTMMGQDTIEQIDQAYEVIETRAARALIIDLRGNPGGAFAVRPLVSHVIDKPLDTGTFVSRRWASENEGYPAIEQAGAVDAWQGWSIRRFWEDLQKGEFLRIRFEPSQPIYRGPIYVLISSETASAAEMAADALAASGRAVLIGERTAGKMLSQSLFDLPGGLQLSLPIGDYHAYHSGRIEGRGV